MCFFKNNTKKTLLSPCKSSSLVGCTSELRLEGMFWCLPGRKSLDCPLVARRNDCIFRWISSTWNGLGPQNRSSQSPLCYKCCALVFVLNTVWSIFVSGSVRTASSHNTAWYWSPLNGYLVNAFHHLLTLPHCSPNILFWGLCVRYKCLIFISVNTV